MKKLIQSGFSGIALISMNALAHPDHGATLMHLHTEEWLGLIGIVAVAAAAMWFRKK